MKIIECPRDAMQGLQEFVPTKTKIQYLNLLLQVGFDTLDFGSFVSSKIIPQMSDTAELIPKLELDDTNTKLLAIVANLRGAEDACRFDEISYLGFPFSISETFQKRNTNSSIQESLARVEEINNLCAMFNKDLVVYLSMAFGNPYNDPWDIDIIFKWTEELYNIGVKTISFADTIGVSTPENIEYVFKNIVPEFSFVEFGAHLHSAPDKWEEKLESAYKNGCIRFDGAIKGFGGCPMAADDLVGNMPTELMLDYLQNKESELNIDFEALNEAIIFSQKIF